MKADRIESRLYNSKRNIISGLVRQMLVVLMTFVVRSVVIFKLGPDYQGLNGLFSSILMVLNVSELGVSTAVTYLLYKPVSENDKQTICAIIAFLKKCYVIIGTFIFGVGLLILPFIKGFIKGEYPRDINIYLIFLIYLINTVISYYLFSYKITFLTATQRIDVVNNIYSLFYLCSCILQILVIVLFQNYYCYVIVLLFFNIIDNIVVEAFSRKLYPDIIPQGMISDELKDKLIRDIKSIFINQIGDISRNAFDNIILSRYLGLVVVTIYGNYYCIYAALYGIMGCIVHSIKASVGNSLVEESVEKNYQDMLRFSFIFMIIVGWCSICLFVLYQPFMLLWMRDERMMLSFGNMILFCIYFYFISMTYTKNLYLEAYGLFYESRKLYILESIGNLVLNIVLGGFLGVTGVLIATIVTIFVFNFLGGTRVLFKNYFKQSEKEFLLQHLFYFGLTVILCFIIKFVADLFDFNIYYDIVLRVILCIVIPAILYYVIYRNNKYFKYFKDIFIV